MTKRVLEFKNVYKSYRNNNVYAVKDFSYRFENGIYGLLGPNGAGKSTLMNMTAQNLVPDKGSITYDGEEIGRMGSSYRERIGYMPQQQGLYEGFTGQQFLWYMAALKGLTKRQASDDIDRILNITNMYDHRYRKIRSYSGGMKQRILIAQALLGDPGILILDEPTAGLDPNERIRIRNYISELSKDRIVILATHVVSDIECIAKRIILMNNGMIVREGAPESVLEDVEGKVYEVIADDRIKEKYEDANVKISNLSMTSGGILLRIVSDSKPEYGIVRSAAPMLEDLYLYYN